MELAQLATKIMTNTPLHVPIFFKLPHFGDNFDGLVQERRNSIANALELRLSCTKPPISTRGFAVISQ